MTKHESAVTAFSGAKELERLEKLGIPPALLKREAGPYFP